MNLKEKIEADKEYKYDQICELFNYDYIYMHACLQEFIQWVKVDATEQCESDYNNIILVQMCESEANQNDNI